jgi:hypothetical protein
MASTPTPDDFLLRPCCLRLHQQTTSCGTAGPGILSSPATPPPPSIPLTAFNTWSSILCALDIAHACLLIAAVMKNSYAQCV